MGPLYQCKFWHFKGENARLSESHCSVTTFAQYMVAMKA